ncbi:EF-hand domain-containing protein D1 [Pseudoliparis swirei]|uniref:EF-hand domain-containing protein D1 n=1 Tax=Pseudoliparis swirei TaxID=2059687 RepID=UPI0024BD6CD4|nr:EF-hand domain-containing protein D1 [Pseudoliparis swirei]
MASDELAKKLQSRMAATQEVEPRPEPVPSPVRPKPQQEAEGACGGEPSSSSELSAVLTRRQDINDGTAAPCRNRVFNPYTEFKEFTRKQIKDMEAMFKRYDTGRDGFIDLMELKLMMEKLGAPQTHLGLKNMIKEVDEDLDNKLSYREFLLIFRRAAAGELQEESGLMALARLSEINVSAEGVMGAKDFFEAKMQALSLGSKFEAEIQEEKDERKRQEVDKKQRQAAFKQLQSAFCS